MPPDLFRAVVARPSPDRSRRPSVVLLSLAAHGAIVLGVVFATLVAPDALPFPRRALAYYAPVQVRLVDVELPSPQPVTKAPVHSGGETAIVTQPTTTPPEPAAPLQAPTGISQETGNEQRALSFESDSPRGDRQPMPVVEHPEIREPPKQVLQVAEPVRLHSGITTPRKVVDAAPVYPPAARAARIEGVVVLEASIDTEGRVTDLRVLRSVPLLDDAALQAVRQWRFTPGRLNGQAVAVIMTVTIRFALDH